MKHVEGYPLTISGYAKYLPASENFVFKVNDFPTDEFHDCSSTGGHDKLNPASDLPEMIADESGLAWYDTFSQEITLMGEASALGKSLTLYALDTPAKVAKGEKEFDGKRVSSRGRLIACCTVTQTNYFR